MQRSERRILLVHNILWSHYKAVVFSRLSALLREHHYALTVVQIAETEHSRQSLGMIDRGLHAYDCRLLFEGAYEQTGLWRRCAGLMREMRRARPALIILPGYADLSSWCALAASRYSGVPVIVSFDSTIMDRRRNWLREQLKKLFIRGCAGALGYGIKSREYLEILGMQRDRIHIRCQATDNTAIADIHLAARAGRARVQKELSLPPRNFIFSGRLSREKNVAQLLRCFLRIMAAGSASGGWGLIIVGDGPERRQLEDVCAAQGASAVRFVGGRSWREVPAYYALADVLVLPSLSEPWGLVVNEAMVCGMPVIVSNRCGAAYDLVQDSVNGFLFDPGSEADLEAKMRYFIDHPERISPMGEASRSIISDHTPENAARQMFSGIRDVMSRPR